MRRIWRLHTCPGGGAGPANIPAIILRKIGAEQKLFDGVTVSGSIGETASGAASKSFGAGFKRSW